MKNIGKTIQFLASIISSFAVIMGLIKTITLLNINAIAEGVLWFIGTILSSIILFVILYAIGELVINSKNKQLIMLADYYAKNGNKEKAEWYINNLIK